MQQDELTVIVEPAKEPRAQAKITHKQPTFLAIYKANLTHGTSKRSTKSLKHIRHISSMVSIKMALSGSVRVNTEKTRHHSAGLIREATFIVCVGTSLLGTTGILVQAHENMASRNMRIIPMILLIAQPSSAPKDS